MAYRDCPCLNCKDRSHGSKRVACQTGCEKYLSWKAKEQELRRREKESRPYYSNARKAIIRRQQIINRNRRGERGQERTDPIHRHD